MKYIKARLIFSLLTVTILLQACGSSSSDLRAFQDTAVLAVAGSYDHVMYVDGIKRTYHLYIPPSFDSAAKSKLLIHLFGPLGNNAASRNGIGFNQISDPEGFIVVYPDAVNDHWNDGRDPVSSSVDDIGFIKALISKLSTALNIGARHAYISGMSNGAIFAHRFACNSSESISAIAAVSGTMAINIYAQCNPSQPVSVLMFHGRDDTHVPWEGGEIPIIGGVVISVDDTMSYWSSFNSCPPLSDTTFLPDLVNDGTTVTRIAFDNVCQNLTSVVLYDIAGGGHTWPGWDGVALPSFGNVSKDIDASLIIWDFFKNNTKQ